MKGWFIRYFNATAKSKKLSSFYNPGLWRLNLGIGSDTGTRLGFLWFGKLCFSRVGKVWDTYPKGYKKN